MLKPREPRAIVRVLWLCCFLRLDGRNVDLEFHRRHDCLLWSRLSMIALTIGLSDGLLFRCEFYELLLRNRDLYRLDPFARL